MVGVSLNTWLFYAVAIMKRNIH